jgi:hypothetical protein
VSTRHPEADAIIALRCHQASTSWETICLQPCTHTRTAFTIFEGTSDIQRMIIGWPALPAPPPRRVPAGAQQGTIAAAKAEGILVRDLNGPGANTYEVDTALV